MAYTEPLYPFYDSPQNPTLKIADTLGRIEGMAGPLNRIADALEKIAEAQTVKLPYGLAEWRGCPGTDHDCVGPKLRDQFREDLDAVNEMRRGKSEAEIEEADRETAEYREKRKTGWAVMPPLAMSPSTETGMAQVGMGFTYGPSVDSRIVDPECLCGSKHPDPQLVMTADGKGTEWKSGAKLPMTEETLAPCHCGEGERHAYTSQSCYNVPAHPKGKWGGPIDVDPNVWAPSFCDECGTPNGAHRKDCATRWGVHNPQDDVEIPVEVPPVEDAPLRVSEHGDELESHTEEAWDRMGEYRDEETTDLDLGMDGRAGRSVGCQCLGCRSLSVRG